MLRMEILKGFIPELYKIVSHEFNMPTCYYLSKTLKGKIDDEYFYDILNSNIIVIYRHSVLYVILDGDIILFNPMCYDIEDIHTITWMFNSCNIGSVISNESSVSGIDNDFSVQFIGKKIMLRSVKEQVYISNVISDLPSLKFLFKIINEIPRLVFIESLINKGYNFSLKYPEDNCMKLMLNQTLFLKSEITN